MKKLYCMEILGHMGDNAEKAVETAMRVYTEWGTEYHQYEHNAEGFVSHLVTNQPIDEEKVHEILEIVHEADVEMEVYPENPENFIREDYTLCVAGIVFGDNEDNTGIYEELS